MSFLKKKERNVDYKSRLEHKLYLARVNPEPDFDLSDCNLKTVPSGVYALCKVFRKEILYLQKNQLTSLSGGGGIEDLYLLHTLDIHSNCLQKLPCDIVSLTNLRELNVSDNRLAQLPENIGEMLNLQLLNVSNNNLKQLPPSIGNLSQLKHLNIQRNSELTKLPSSLCRAISIKEILLDKDNFMWPPKNVIEGGVSAIFQFLCSEEGIEYVSPEKIPIVKGNEVMDDKEDNNDVFQAKILQLEILKDQKQQERLKLEQSLFEHQRRELELQSTQKNNKGKLLEDLVHQQCLIEKEISKVHQEREVERLRLVNEIQQVETAANNLVSQLLASCNMKDALHIQVGSYNESEEEQRLLSLSHEHYQSLRHKDIICSMEGLLKEEMLRAAKMQEIENERAESARSILDQEVKNGQALGRVLLSQERDREGLINQLQYDEELQRAAVTTLLERSDSQSWALTQHLRLVQEQLSTLTALEIKHRQLQTSKQMDELCQSRAALTELLVDLVTQRTARRKHLLETLSELDRRHRKEEEKQANHFWLVQYQRLLDLHSGDISELEQNVDHLLALHLIQNGVVHCLPLLFPFVLHPSTLGQITHEKLLQSGISSFKTRECVLRAVNLYLDDQKRRSQLFGQPTTSQKPSAPSFMEVELPSTLQDAECVICMDDTCAVVFVPCGHLCCCMKCSDTVESCPLCRSNVAQRIRVLLP